MTFLVLLIAGAGWRKVEGNMNLLPVASIHPSLTLSRYYYRSVCCRGETVGNNKPVSPTLVAI